MFCHIILHGDNCSQPLHFLSVLRAVFNRIVVQSTNVWTIALICQVIGFCVEMDSCSLSMPVSSVCQQWTCCNAYRIRTDRQATCRSFSYAYRFIVGSFLDMHFIHNAQKCAEFVNVRHMRHVHVMCHMCHVVQWLKIKCSTRNATSRQTVGIFLLKF